MSADDEPLKPHGRRSKLLRRDDPRPSDKVELPSRKAEPEGVPNQMKVGSLMVEVVKEGSGKLSLMFKGDKAFRVRRARMGAVPVAVRFKVRANTVVALSIEEV